MNILFLLKGLFSSSSSPSDSQSISGKLVFSAFLGRIKGKGCWLVCQRKGVNASEKMFGGTAIRGLTFNIKWFNVYTISNVNFILALLVTSVIWVQLSDQSTMLDWLRNKRSALTNKIKLRYGVNASPSSKPKVCQES